MDHDGDTYRYSKSALHLTQARLPVSYRPFIFNSFARKILYKLVVRPRTTTPHHRKPTGSHCESLVEIHLQTTARAQCFSEAVFTELPQLWKEYSISRPGTINGTSNWRHNKYLRKRLKGLISPSFVGGELFWDLLYFNKSNSTIS